MTRGKVLVVDDELHLRVFLSTAFKTAGYEVVCAPNGDKGLEAARKERPDLITLDLMMPGEGGVTMYQGLQSDPELNATPVIVVSAVEARTFLHSLRTVAAGRGLTLPEPAAYEEKPPNPNRLLRLAAELIGGRGTS
ncbi:response regulator [Paucidesulfovibrio longus]|uniref:response regulator n=1 Tax=Paucidesulfovibrio longus TaxID=889 RepID=UPI0003B5C256|nr:response regulator [Paucidesulfovibrio longus]